MAKAAKAMERIEETMMAHLMSMCKKTKPKSISTSDGKHHYIYRTPRSISPIHFIERRSRAAIHIFNIKPNKDRAKGLANRLSRNAMIRGCLRLITRSNIAGVI